eukprot:TRINITY_DN2769_c0_g1_i2.p1 TRINITY_DN2769_c0_g1~~TRINITY_DN2769_c0_g1_i2.p1  ORF type:complete len:289 (+),score=68.08 TRINITY_DN2769_c0_g1_i2:1-867(+)
MKTVKTVPKHFQSGIKYDDFLSNPTTTNKSVRQLPSSYVSHDDQFLIKSTQEAQQYFKEYTNRLNRLKSVLLDRVKEWKKKNNSNTKLQDKILHIQDNEESIVIGTIYKEMPLKPNVLTEYAKERAILPVPAKDSYISEKDAVFLEDETGRTKLRGISFNIQDFVTGMVIAVRGKGIEGGAEFEVYDVIEPGLPPQTKLKPKSQEQYVALISGLNFGKNGVNPLLYHLLSDYLTGHTGSSSEHEFQASITRVVIAGNSVFTEDEEKLHDQGLVIINYILQHQQQLRRR